MSKQINLNTFVLGFIALLIGVVGFFCRRELDRIDATQRQMWSAIMPRHEIEIEIQSVKATQSRLENDQYEFRGRLTKIELDVARLRGGRKDP